MRRHLFILATAFVFVLATSLWTLADISPVEIPSTPGDFADGTVLTQDMFERLFEDINTNFGQVVGTLNSVTDALTVEGDKVGLGRNANIDPSSPLSIRAEPEPINFRRMITFRDSTPSQNDILWELDLNRDGDLVLTETQVATWLALKRTGDQSRGEIAVGSASSPADLVVNGSVSMDGASVSGVKNFRIDHPLDPTNRYLLHASVEAPEMMNIYSGNVTTDANGFATVTLPEYFGALNHDFRYQLTVVGQFAQAIVAKKIEDNHFVIQTDTPEVEVSWQVSGIRRDPYAMVNPLQVEQWKPVVERGKYLHPEAYSLGKTLATVDD